MFALVWYHHYKLSAIRTQHVHLLKRGDWRDQATTLSGVLDTDHAP